MAQDAAPAGRRAASDERPAASDGNGAASDEHGAASNGHGAGPAGQAGEPGARVLVHETRIPIRWGDMDAMGHVNNTVYFRYMEQLRIEWFAALGFAPDPGGQGPVIVDAHCTFVRELVYPGVVLARQFAGDVGRSSWQTWVELRRDDDPDTVYAHGAARCVWVDYPRRRSAPLPAPAREAILRPWRAPL